MIGSKPLLAYFSDTLSAFLRMDASTHALEMIDYPHHEIHNGNSYFICKSAAGASGTKATITFSTPDTAKWFHLVVSARSNVESIFTVGEGATVTADSGTDFEPRNRNRNSANTSSTISAGSTGGDGFATVGGTVTDFGISLCVKHFGLGRIGGESREIREWVLKSNTVYALEVESEAATSEIEIEANWYELTNKN